MKTPAPADLQRWSEDVARDAASLSFLPLARAYRRQGRRDAAMRLCLRGLEHHPDHIDAHGLLAVLYFESGQRVRAYDEWSMVLTLEPENFDALRGMGFFYLEQQDYLAAKQHLERAEVQKPNDPAVHEGLHIINERLGQSSLGSMGAWEQGSMAAAEPAAETPEDDDEPWASAPVSDTVPVTIESESASASETSSASATVHASVGAGDVAPAPVPPKRMFLASPPPVQPRMPAAAAPVPVMPPAVDTSAEPLSDDPALIFSPIMKGGHVLGALILDAQGLVMGGSLSADLGEQAEALGAILSGAIEEAVRTAQYLSLGEWKGVLLEADQAMLHFAPIGDGMIVLLAAEKSAPTGWVLRSANQASRIATRFLEAYA